jgi:hypothetical protein
MFFWLVKLGGEWGWPSEERARLLESNESFCIGNCVIYWTNIFVTKPYKGYVTRIQCNKDMSRELHIEYKDQNRLFD